LLAIIGTRLVVQHPNGFGGVSSAARDEHSARLATIGKVAV
jgi:hypothetical protein